MRRLLVFGRDHLGDLVNTTGAVAALRKRFPADTITLEAGGAATELFPEVEVWKRPRGHPLDRWRRILRFRKGRFDLAVVFDDSHMYPRLARLAGIREIVGAHKGKPELYTRAYAFQPGGHDLFPILEGVLDLLDAGPYPGPVLPLPPGEADRRGVGLFLGASERSKTWPLGHWRDLIRILHAEGRAVHLFGGPDEQGAVAELAAETGATAEPMRRILPLAERFREMEAIVAADTGPAHLAAAAGTYTVILYGPAPPTRGHPWGTHWRALYEPNPCELYGRGCAHLEGGTCPQKCMAAVTPEAVAQALRS